MAKNMCWRCGATQASGEFPFTDFSDSAKWRTTIFTMAKLLAYIRKLNVTPSPIFSIPGFMLHMIVIDVLHTLDLGITQDALGNVFWSFIKMSKDNKDAALQKLWCKMQSYHQ